MWTDDAFAVFNTAGELVMFGLLASAGKFHCFYSGEANLIVLSYKTIVGAPTGTLVAMFTYFLC